MKSSLPEQLAHLLERKDRFTYDLRAGCQVYEGVVAVYRTEDGKDHFATLAEAVAHALANDGIIGGWKDPATREIIYDSCRLFTDQLNAVRFAKQQDQKAVYNLTRDREVFISPTVELP